MGRKKINELSYLSKINQSCSVHLYKIEVWCRTNSVGKVEIIIANVFCDDPYPPHPTNLCHSYPILITLGPTWKSPSLEINKPKNKQNMHF